MAVEQVSVGCEVAQVWVMDSTAFLEQEQAQVLVLELAMEMAMVWAPALLLVVLLVHHVLGLDVLEVHLLRIRPDALEGGQEFHSVITMYLQFVQHAVLHGEGIEHPRRCEASAASPSCIEEHVQESAMSGGIAVG